MKWNNLGVRCKRLKSNYKGISSSIMITNFISLPPLSMEKSLLFIHELTWEEDKQLIKLYPLFSQVGTTNLLKLGDHYLYKSSQNSPITLIGGTYQNLNDSSPWNVFEYYSQIFFKFSKFWRVNSNLRLSGQIWLC